MAIKVIGEKDKISSEKPLIKPKSTKVPYDQEIFLLRIDNVIEREGLTLKELAHKLGYSERYFRGLRNQPEKYHSKNAFDKLERQWEITFPIWYVIALIKIWSADAPNDFHLEIYMQEFRGIEGAKRDYDHLDDFYNPENNSLVIDKFMNKNPTIIAGKIRYWLSHYDDIKNHREAMLFADRLLSLP